MVYYKQVIGKLLACEFRHYECFLAEHAREMADSMAPVIAWGFVQISLNIRPCWGVIATDRHTALLVKPHIGHGFFIERPAARVDHERDHEEVNGSANQAVHVRRLYDIASPSNSLRIVQCLQGQNQCNHELENLVGKGIAPVSHRFFTYP